MIMDFQWSYGQASDLNRGQHNNRKDDYIDLTLKLGFPSGCNDQNQDQLFGLVPNIAPQGQANFNPCDQSHTQRRNSHYSMTNNAQSNVHGVGGQFSGGSSLVTVAPFNFSRSQSQINFNLNLNPNRPPFQAVNNIYTIVDIPRRRVKRSGNSSSSGGVLRRQLGYLASRQRCSNYNCNTDNTPMWRQGPLGPQTLCNACGIRYFRMEEKRRKASEAASSSRYNGQESNN